MKDQKNVFRSLTLITQFGIYMIVPILLCTFLGIFLDRLLSTSFLVIVLFFVGALAGFTNIFRLAKRIYSRSDQEHIQYFQVRDEKDHEQDQDPAEGK